MGTEIDPEGLELDALLSTADFRDARVAEIGSGSGRLTRRYAQAARLVAGVESSADVLGTAARDRPRELSGLTYLRGAAPNLPFRGDAFDVVLFGWSL